MLRETALPVVVAGLLVLAGCAGASGPLVGSGNPSDSPDAQTGTVNFYISDERNAIDDFEHLNVTITKVGFQKQGEDDADEESDVDENETEVDDESESQRTESATDQNETETADNETATPEETTEESESEVNANETEVADEADDAEDENESREGWVERDVDNVTIDLTEYQGANATLLSSFDVSNGTYSKVFVYVSEINATLENGEQVNVKLPSQKLQLNSEFTVGNGEETDFVFDITVFKAGNSGKYILKPVVSESGTDVPIEADDRGNSDEQGPPEDPGENGADDQDNDENPALDVSADGPVMAGEDVSIQVTDEGEGVGNAQVFVDGERVGQTDAGGTISVDVPEAAESVEVTVRYRGTEVETTVMVQSGSGDETTTAAT